MTEDGFWRLIDQARLEAPSGAEVPDRLERHLRALTPDEVAAFDRRFYRLRGQSYDWRRSRPS